MDRMTRRYAPEHRRGMRTSRTTRILALAAAAVMFTGLFAQIAVRAQISGQAKEIAAVQRQIQTMDANAENLSRYINEYHDLEDIGKRALELGMQQPQEDQLRVIRLPALADTQAQTVANSGSENVSG